MTSPRLTGCEVSTRDILQKKLFSFELQINNQKVNSFRVLDVSKMIPVQTVKLSNYSPMCICLKHPRRKKHPPEKHWIHTRYIKVSVFSAALHKSTSETCFLSQGCTSTSTGKGKHFSNFRRMQNSMEPEISPLDYFCKEFILILSILRLLFSYLFAYSK